MDSKAEVATGYKECLFQDKTPLHKCLTAISFESWRKPSEIFMKDSEQLLNVYDLGWAWDCVNERVKLRLCPPGPGVDVFEDVKNSMDIYGYEYFQRALV